AGRRARAERRRAFDRAGGAVRVADGAAGARGALAARRGAVRGSGPRPGGPPGAARLTAFAAPRARSGGGDGRVRRGRRGGARGGARLARSRPTGSDVGRAARGPGPERRTLGCQRARARHDRRALRALRRPGRPRLVSTLARPTWGYR